jgi:hypothetical protein
MPIGLKKTQENNPTFIAYLPLKVINVHILKSGYNKRYLPLVNGKSLLFGHAH